MKTDAHTLAILFVCAAVAAVFLVMAFRALCDRFESRSRISRRLGAGRPVPKATADAILADWQAQAAQEPRYHVRHRAF